jgi:Heparinase II/III-like protein
LTVENPDAMTLAFLLVTAAAVEWQHPAGMITDETIAEVREKTETQAWAKRLHEARKKGLQRWVDLSSEELRRIFPEKGGNVYHNFSCPKDRVRLTFDAFNPDAFECPVCKETFDPHADAGIYEPGYRYHGDMYEGWICLFHLTTVDQMVDMALIGRMEKDERLVARAIELLMLYADTIKELPLREPGDLPADTPGFPQYCRILTYHREGDNKILFCLAQVYELLRDRMKPEQCARVEKHVLERLLNDMMLEPHYTYDHNNVYQWHRTIVQTALALEREDLIDWSFGYGAYSPEALPEHRSMVRILATHFNADGAFWELCSGYHLYPLTHLCQFAVLSRNLSRMDPERFPAARYDLTGRDSEGGKVIHNALAWFVSMAMPDRSMTIIGDSTIARAGMDSYTTTAEVGYRYYDIQAVGDYAKLREGSRSWDGLVYGAPEIKQHDTPFTSSNLSSGWVSLRSTWEDNRLWVGLNALIKGGGHQHADRLTLTTFSQGQLLALEKSVPYNESTLRELGTLTPAHNTVTVDMTSQKQGETLTEEETPEVVFFHAGPIAQYAEIHGDDIYPQTSVYRRSVAVVEDIAIDVFRVEGGTTHDWIVHHAGTAPVLSLSMAPGTFTPEKWLANGSGKVLAAETGGTWSAQWPVDDVTSRLTMLGAAGTQVFGLETYPLNNAVIAPDYPACQTLCVRRTQHAPFVAVWDAWTDAPNLRAVTPSRNRPDALTVKTASHTYHLAFGPGVAEYEDGTVLNTDAAFTLVRDSDAAVLMRDREPVLVVHATRLSVRHAADGLTVSLEEPATISANWDPDGFTVKVAGDIQYDTYGGQDHPREAPSVEPSIGGSCSGTAE